MRYASTPHTASHAASVVWSISFGDLLTLLVCFFLVLTPWDALRIASNVPTNQEVVVIPRELDVVGINLAQSPSVPQVSHRIRRDNVVGADRSVSLRAEVPLYKNQIGDVSVRGLEEMVAALHREIPEVLRRDSVVLLRLCGEDTAVESIAPMVGRVLKEVGVTEKQLVLSYPSVPCDEVATMRPVTATLVGSVTVLQEQAPHT